MTPEYLHAVVNHIPIIGLPMLIVPLAWSLIRKEPHTLGVSLALLIVLAISARVVMWSGEQAYDRYESGPPSAHIDATGLAWIDTHEHRAEVASFMLYLVGVGAIAGLVYVVRRKKACRWIAGGALAGVLLCSGLMVWTAQAGGKIVHVEFRSSPTEQPPPPLPWAHDDEDE